MPNHPLVDSLKPRSNSGPWARTFRVVGTDRIALVACPVRLFDEQVAEAAAEAFNAGYRVLRVIHNDGSTTFVARKACQTTAKVLRQLKEVSR